MYWRTLYATLVFLVRTEILTKRCLQETGQLQRKLEPAERILSISSSPSRFVKSDFRESDYESDYDGRSASLARKQQTGSGSVPLS